MRNWLFHPLLFYPLVAIIAAFVIVVSLRPQDWPRDPAPVAAVAATQGFQLSGEALGTPAPAPEQNLRVVRDFLGRANALRIAVKPESARQPTGQEHGVRVLLAPETSAQINGKPVIVEVTYNALSVNAASGLAVSLQSGDGPPTWVSMATPPQPTTVMFQLPAQPNVTAIGLRALSQNDDQAYGLEITRIRLIPHA